MKPRLFNAKKIRLSAFTLSISSENASAEVLLKVKLAFKKKEEIIFFFLGGGFCTYKSIVVT